MNYIKKILTDMKENKIFIINNIVSILIFIIFICIIPLLNNAEEYEGKYLFLVKYKIDIVALVLVFIFLVKTNYRFIKDTTRKIYNIILNIFMPIILMSLIGMICINLINNIAQTNILCFWGWYSFNEDKDSKYEITFNSSGMELSSYNTYYIDLKRKEVIEISENFCLDKQTSRQVRQKKIDDSTNGQIRELFQELDSVGETELIINKDTFQTEEHVKSEPGEPKTITESRNEYRKKLITELKYQLSQIFE